MSVEVRIGGRTRTVAVTQPDRAGRLLVTVDGQERAVNAAWIDSETLSLIVDGVVHDVGIRRSGAGTVTIDVHGTVFEADIAEAGAGRSHARESAARNQPGGRTIAAPMPGRVVRVLVDVGERVPARYGVVVVEAMKMENVLRAPSEGTVREIRVAAGSTVEAGAVLVVLD